MCMLTKQVSKHRNALHEACVWICDAHKDGEPNASFAYIPAHAQQCFAAGELTCSEACDFPKRC